MASLSVAFLFAQRNMLWLPPSPQMLWAAQILLCGDFIQEAAADVSCCREQRDAQLLITTGPYFTLPLLYPLPGQCRCLHLNTAHGVSACAMPALGPPVWCWEHPCPLGLNGGPLPLPLPRNGLGWQSPRGEGAASSVPTGMASTMRAFCVWVCGAKGILPFSREAS